MQGSFSNPEYGAKKKVTRRDRISRRDRCGDAVTALAVVVEPFYPRARRGRPPVGQERMLRMCMAQQCFGLSDERTKTPSYDSQAIRSLVGINQPRSGPDGHRLFKFRRLLEAHQLAGRLFSAVNVHLAAKALMLRKARWSTNAKPLRGSERTGPRVVTLSGTLRLNRFAIVDCRFVQHVLKLLAT